MAGVNGWAGSASKPGHAVFTYSHRASGWWHRMPPMVRRRRFRLGLLAAAIATVAPGPTGPRLAQACSVALGPQSLPRYPWFAEPGFPSNGVFVSSLDWRDEAGQPMVLVEDAAASALWGAPVRRPATALAPGSVWFPTSDCPDRGACAHRLVIGSTDTTPPTAAVLADVTTFLVTEPTEPGGCSVSCGDYDTLVLRVSGSDDTTPPDHLGILAYVGQDEREVAARTTPDLVVGYDAGPPERTRESTIILGGSLARDRDGGPLRAKGRFCFAVALMDWAGNVGARSAITCLDTTDEDDPTVAPVDTHGCDCGGGP